MSRKIEIADVEWKSVIAVLLLKKYEEADEQLHEYLLKNPKNDDTILAELSIMLSDADFYLWMKSEETCLRFDSLRIDAWIKNADIALPEILSLSEKVQLRFCTYFDAFLSCLCATEDARRNTFILLSKYRALMPSLSLDGILSSDLRLEEYLSDFNDAIEDVVCDVVERLKLVSVECYCREIEWLGYLFLQAKNFEKAQQLLREGVSCSFGERKITLQYYLMLSTLEVRNEDEFIECNKFRYENEEYVRLLHFAADNHQRKNTYVELADYNMSRHRLQRMRAEQALMQEERLKKREEERQRDRLQNQAWHKKVKEQIGFEDVFVTIWECLMGVAIVYMLFYMFGGHL